MKQKVRWLIDNLLVVGLILTIAYSMGLLTGFAKGNDIFAYLTKIRLIDTYFPHINWNPFWDSGTPFSIWSYPPLAMTSTTFLLVKLLGMTYEHSLTIMAAFAFCLMGVGLYGFAYETTGRRFAGILAVVLFVSSPASWNWWAVGNYVRVFGMGFFAMALWALSGFIKRYLENRPNKAWLLATLIFSSLGASSHLLIGGITFVVIFFYVLFTIPTLGKKIKFWLLFLSVSFLSAAYFYLPMFLTGHIGGRFIGINPGYPIPIKNWFYPQNAEYGFSLSPSLSICFLAGFILLSIYLLIRGSRLTRFEKGSIFAFGLFVLGNTAYNSAGFLPFYPETGYIVGFPPITAFALLSFTWAAGGAIFLGIALPKILTKVKIANVLLIFIIIGGLFNTYYFLNILKETVINLSRPGSAQDLAQHGVNIPEPNDFNHRFGTDSGLVADWFTYYFNMPQTRDYFGQGIPYINWQNWMEMGIWYWTDNWAETRFLLDWYAIKYIFVFEPHFNINKFLTKPEEFSLVTKRDNWVGMQMAEFEYKYPSTVMSAVNTPTLLIDGAYAEYDVFLRALSRTGLDSKKIIPLYSSKKIDSFSLKELTQFNTIFLYNYSYGDFNRMEKLLSDYVNAGGNLIVDTFRGNDSASDRLPAFFPVSQTTLVDILKQWNFIQSSSPLLTDVNISAFGEASYFNNPWHVSIAQRQYLRPGAEVLLENDKGIMMASQNFGQGKVLWSGINFPFHLVDKKSPEEARLLQNIATWLGFDKVYDVSPSNYKFNHPEKREVNITTPAKGVLFKETGFMDWQVKDCQESNNKCRNSKIYFAGPGFMYVFLDQSDFPRKLIFEYHLSWIEKLSFTVAGFIWLALLIFLIELIIRRPIISSRVSSLIHSNKIPFLAHATGWWDKDEE
ncbi:MAG: hypothetical protein V1858_05645 [Candidatus Gottesmanbacteria bacterium]